MPRYDQTGPDGQGPKTGKQLGNCEGTEPNSSNYTLKGAGLGRGLGPCGRGLGRGCGRGMGLGRGFGWRAQATQLTPEQEKQILETQKGKIEKRLKELDS